MQSVWLAGPAAVAASLLPLPDAGSPKSKVYQEMEEGTEATHTHVQLHAQTHTETKTGKRFPGG